MPVRKRNEYLDDGDDDSSADAGYDSDVPNRLAKGRTERPSRATKKRKQESSDDDLSAEDSQDESEIDDRAEALQPTANISSVRPDRDTSAAFQTGQSSTAPEITADGDQHVLQRTVPRSIAKAEKAARKSGVLYISRVPPFMKPHTLKHFLEPHASKGIGRIFLTPEEHSSYISRKKSGGNKKKSFTDGWIEFTSKTEAKIAAETLNGNIIGGKKGGYYHDDLWNIKYLSGFKWSHLTDQIAAENAEREARMREEIRRTRKENKTFLEDYERGKMLETMDRKKKAKGISESSDQRTIGKSKARDFQQAKTRHASDRETNVDDDALKRTLSMIF